MPPYKRDILLVIIVLSTVSLPRRRTRVYVYVCVFLSVCACPCIHVVYLYCLLLTLTFRAEEGRRRNVVRAHTHPVAIRTTKRNEDPAFRPRRSSDFPESFENLTRTVGT